MGDWQAGDLAVCIDDSPCRDPNWAGESFGIPRGTVLRVRSTRYFPFHDCFGLAFFDWPDPPKVGFYGSTRFRKIRPADDTFTALIRKCRPNPCRQSTPRELAKLFGEG